MQKVKLVGRLQACSRFVRQLATQQPQPPEQPQWYKPEGQDATGIRVYNCAAKRQVPLVLPNEHYATWYTCGPTVYDSTHLGHASCYVKLDIIQRILREHFQINLVTAMNITDIDDKIIRKSQETGRDWREIAKYYESEFWTDMRKLYVGEPNLKVRVTEQMHKIIAFIESIMAQQQAYVGQDQSVYFNVKKYPIYGKLQKQNIIETDEKLANKSAAADFALWKARKSVDEPAWDSPWGAGRPGWHIECSALASMIFGSNIDFHAGGLDLRFPHHENEEAQSCVHHNTDQWVNYWLHTGQLNIRGETVKMSKSVGNTIGIDDMLSQYTADDFRMACVLSNYRNTMEYSDEMMATACNTLNRFKSFAADCQAYLTGKKLGASNLDVSTQLRNLHYTKQQINECLQDDFDTARCISVLLDQISTTSRYINTNPNNETTMTDLKSASCLDTIAAIDNFVQRILRSFGFVTFAVHSNDARAQTVQQHQRVDLNSLLEDILQSRRNIRDRAFVSKNKDLFQICDELRNCLRQHGIEIRDHDQGSTWSFNNKL